MITHFQRLLAVACTIVFFLGYSSTAWSTTLTGAMSDYLYCAKDDGKKGGKKGTKGEEEEPDCEE